MPKIKHELEGRIFGKLTVMSESKKIKFPSGKIARTWLCSCACGVQKVIRQDHLLSGVVVSYGCVMRSISRERGRYGKDNGLTRIAFCWRNMIARCQNSNNPNFHHYGGRGIKVCERWHSVENFIADMPPMPPGMELDRIDNDGDYEPGNCRWATRQSQMRNTRGNVKLTIDGETRCIQEWSEISGINPGAIRARLKYGWDAKTAVFKPSMRKSGLLATLPPAFGAA
jgi:hypothetical protein